MGNSICAESALVYLHVCEWITWWQLLTIFENVSRNSHQTFLTPDQELPNKYRRAGHGQQTGGRGADTH